MHEVFDRVEQGRARQLPDRDHPRDLRATTTPRPAKPLVDLILDTAGQKGTGKWTGRLGARPRRAADADRRGGVRPLPVGPEGRAGRGQQGAARARRRRRRRRQGAVHRRRRAWRSTPRKIISLRPGLRADDAMAAGEYGWKLEQRRHRPDVARRLHHPQRLPRQDQGGLRQQPERWRTCCSTRTSPARSGRRQDGWRRVVAAAATQRHPGAGHSPAPWPTTTATARARLPANLLRPSATTSARTPTSGPTSRAASSSTPTGPAAAAPPSSSTYNA